MGLGAFYWAWQRQTKDFGHDQATKYTCLVFDNRGIGGSDKPLLRYSTSEMAKDTLELLDQLGWTNERQLHVIGSSLGGMIAQELVTLRSPSSWELFRFPFANDIVGPSYPPANSFLISAIDCCILGKYCGMSSFTPQEPNIPDIDPTHRATSKILGIE